MSNSKRALAAIVLSAAVAAAFLGGCTKVVSAPANSSINTVTAPGSGTVSSAPDQAVMSFGVSAQAKDAKAALDAVSAKADKVGSAIKGAGVADKDIQTANVSINPQYDNNSKSSNPPIIGYQASLSVTAKVRDLASLSKVIGVATAAGIDNVNGPTFSIADDSPQQGKAIQKAVDDARRTAESMAKAAGKSVGQVVSITAEPSATGVRPLAYGTYAPMADATKAVPIEPGQLDVNANVTVVFELK
jgi:uncharacterized protein YggE